MPLWSPLIVPPTSPVPVAWPHGGGGLTWPQGQTDGQQGEEDGLHGHRRAAVGWPQGGFILLGLARGRLHCPVNMDRFPGPAGTPGWVDPNLGPPCQAAPRHSLCLSVCFRKAGPAQARGHPPHSRPLLTHPRVRRRAEPLPTSQRERGQIRVSGRAKVEGKPPWALLCSQGSCFPRGNRP